MNRLKNLMDKFNGNAFNQEFLCLDAADFYQPLRLLAFDGEHFLSDLTDQHIFSGYHPLILSFPQLLPLSARLPEKMQLGLYPAAYPNGNLPAKDALASLELKRIMYQEDQSVCVQHYEGISGRHHFLPAFHQVIMNFSNRWFNRKKNNVYLHSSLLRQVQIAYALPRNISILSLELNGKVNMFPTDLHGQAGGMHYLDSLRTGGLALKQVLSARLVLLSEMEPEHYRRVYSMGPNHMKEPLSPSSFALCGQRSRGLGLPVPEGASFIRELELVDVKEHGIHSLLLFRLLSAQQWGPKRSSLAHIHSTVGTWRKKQGLEGNYLLR